MSKRLLYRLADWTDVSAKSRTVLWAGYGLWRYDYETERWVDDRRMYGIYTGSPESVGITEAQARDVIERNGGTWVEPPH